MPAVNGKSATPRCKSTHLALVVDMGAGAQTSGGNVSQAAEIGFAATVARGRQAQWLAENQAALQSSNAFVQKHGVALSRYRNF